jgi:hypothetical protein
MHFQLQAAHATIKHTPVPALTCIRTLASSSFDAPTAVATCTGNEGQQATGTKGQAS